MTALGPDTELASGGGAPGREVVAQVTGGYTTMNALGTEYFVLQSTASSSSSPRAFASLAFTVLPTVFVLGWFTIVRLIDTSVANIVSLRRMELIRAHYAALAPMAPPYFGAGNSATGEHGVSYGRWSFLFTMASMVITVNCVLGGATIALLALSLRSNTVGSPRSSSART